MMPNNFRVGDVVRLKSGGPFMTIIAHEAEFGTATENGRDMCIWLCGDGTIGAALFERRTLMRKEDL
jgi:uncharacterized protein YodC (DUF2158 family)